MMLTDQQQRIVELTKEREALKERLKESKEELNALLTEAGVGTHFQDPSDGTVFEVIVPTGTFISFDTIGYNRTKREGERAGTLSMKKAKELGYEI
jgi:hypothetical protein